MSKVSKIVGELSGSKEAEVVRVQNDETFGKSPVIQGVTDLKERKQNDVAISGNIDQVHEVGVEAAENVVENPGLVGSNANTMGDQVGETVVGENQVSDQDAPFGDGKQVVSNDEECEEVWHNEELVAAQSIEVKERKETGVLSKTPNKERLIGKHQGELALGYSSDQEEGEIPLILGKEKVYESDGDVRFDARKTILVEDKVVRKSQRVHTRSQKLNL